MAHHCFLLYRYRIIIYAFVLTSFTLFCILALNFNFSVLFSCDHIAYKHTQRAHTHGLFFHLLDYCVLWSSSASSFYFILFSSQMCLIFINLNSIFFVCGVCVSQAHIYIYLYKISYNICVCVWVYVFVYLCVCIILCKSFITKYKRKTYTEYWYGNGKILC